MKATVPSPDFRHLALWPARGARFGDGGFSYGGFSYGAREPQPAEEPRGEGEAPERAAEG
ncbi:MAG: hypothetical protein JXQ91_11535 [Vannielia sp.]|uniref:hypothetical protein n=1 Tax=Vannielia sp. TaxID=2813045 RepID=UPI003B8C1A80